MYFCVAWLTILMVNNTIPLQHVVIIRTWWCPKEWIFERVRACHTNVPLGKVCYIASLGACLSVCVVLSQKFPRNITDWLRRKWVDVFLVLSLTFVLEWRTCDGCCRRCVSQCVWCLSVWCCGDAEEEWFCRWLDPLPLSASSGFLGCHVVVSACLSSPCSSVRL